MKNDDNKSKLITREIGFHIMRDLDIWRDAQRDRVFQVLEEPEV